ncbi:MAG: tRNA (adenosine(37)-N6)-threonylcarbamoyltransferase complex dimerization subunit type 1 TsaB [Hungatella sp.]
MRILGIESSSLVASVAVVSDDILIAEYTVNLKKTHSQTLLPMIDEIMTMLEMEPSSMDAIAVSGGPGSFTGLRIGSATAKGLGLALQKPLIHVPTIDAMAYNLYGTSALICPIMDARRNQVYTGLYHCAKNLDTLLNPCAMDMKELMERLNERQESVIFLGDGVPVYRTIIEEGMTAPYEFAPAHMNRQRAGAVAALGALYLQENREISAADFEPDYLRRPQAERERAERERSERERPEREGAEREGAEREGAEREGAGQI